MNKQATHATDEGAWQLRPWPNDATVAQLIINDQHYVPTPAVVEAAIERSIARGAVTIRTSALFPSAATVLTEAGFSAIDTLALLRTDVAAYARLRGTTQARHSESSVVDLRPLRAWHHGAAATIDRAAFGDLWGNTTRSLGEIRNATPTHRAMIAKVDRQAVGFLIAGAAGLNGYVQRLAVDPSHRRSGIATALVDDALAWMHTRGALAALVNTGIDNTAALTLYDRLGFTRMDQELTIAEYDLKPRL